MVLLVGVRIVSVVLNHCHGVDIEYGRSRMVMVKIAVRNGVRAIIGRACAVASTAVELGYEHAVPVMELIKGDGKDLRSASVDGRATGPGAGIQGRTVEDLRARCWSELLLQVPKT